MSDTTENTNDATVPADDQRNTNADAGETTQPDVNRVEIRDVTKPGTGFGIIGGVHPPPNKPEQ